MVMDAEFGDIVVHWDASRDVKLLFIETVKNNSIGIGDKADIFYGIVLSNREDLLMREYQWDSWVKDSFIRERKATPDEILKAIIRTKKEDIRSRLKRLLRERL